MSLPVLVVKHEDDSPPGLLGAWLDARSIAWVCPPPDEVPADPAPYAAIVSLGWTAGANDPLPAIDRELALVQRAIDEAVPVLGLCFGCQLLARAAGGTVAVTPPGEFGWTYPAGAPSPITQSPWFCWHDDTFTLPPGAELLADGPLCPQAFALGPHTGFQFHPEVDLATIDRWLQARAGSEHPPLDLAPTFEANRTLLAGLQERAFRLFDWWLERSGAQVGPRVT